jgi:hypothetical protein
MSVAGQRPNNGVAYRFRTEFQSVGSASGLLYFEDKFLSLTKVAKLHGRNTEHLSQECDFNKPLPREHVVFLSVRSEDMLPRETPQECGMSVAGQRPSNGVVSSLGSVLRIRCRGNIFLLIIIIHHLLLGKGGVFFSVRSEAVTETHHIPFGPFGRSVGIVR